MLKRYAIVFGGEEWGMEILCDTPSQANELCKVFQSYYGDELDQLEIYEDGKLFKSIISGAPIN